MKAVFDISANSRYNDKITHFYQFPRDYLNIAEQTVGDWVIYRNTSRGSGTTDYFGTALVQNVIPDPRDASLYYANVSFFIPFANPVALRMHGTSYWESYINRIKKPQQVGVRLRGKAMRLLTDSEFGEIAFEGFKESLQPSNFERFGLPEQDEQLLNELLLANAIEIPRKITKMFVRKPIRDANFRHIVLNAYGNKCAITGLQVINGGGRPEAQAAHIRPVARGGPDMPNNGIALSATCHWLFDRHLISLDEKFQLLVSRKVRSSLGQLNLKAGQGIHLPRKKRLRPDQTYLEEHRSLLVT